MAWTKLTKQALPTTGTPTTFGAVGTILYDSATDTLYKQTAATEWSIYPLGTRAATPETGAGTLRISGTSLFEKESFFVGSGSINISGNAEEVLFDRHYLKTGSGSVIVEGAPSILLGFLAEGSGSAVISGEAASEKEDA
jgi:hypothetical protein